MVVACTRTHAHALTQNDEEMVCFVAATALRTYVPKVGAFFNVQNALTATVFRYSSVQVCSSDIQKNRYDSQ